MKKLLYLTILLLLFTSLNAQKIASGVRHTIVLCKDSTVWAWGDNEYGQLGNGTFDSSAVPIQVNGLTGVVAVFASGVNSFAITSDGSLWGWGFNEQYNLGLGIGNSSNKNLPVKIPVNNVRSVYSFTQFGGAGFSFTYAVTKDSILWGWGYSSFLFGDSGIFYSDIPIQDTLFNNVVSVGGGEAVLVLLGDGTVWGWGGNSRGSLGTGDTKYGYYAVQTKNLNNVSMLSSNGNDVYSLAVKQDNTVWAWGYNQLYGNLGDSSNFNRFEPVKINGVSNVKKVVATQGYASYALHHNGTVSAWGNNVSGRLGNAEPMSSRNYPAQVSVISNVVDIAAGGSHAIALTSDGKLWAWGQNNKGQLGDGTLINKNTPVQVQGICEIDVEVNVSEVSLKPIQYSIYPNPATYTLYINFTTTTPNKIEVLDLHGRTLFTESVSSSQSSCEIPLGNLSNGVYFVKLYSNEGVVLKKVVKE